MLYPFTANYLFEHRQDSLMRVYNAQFDKADATIKTRLHNEALRYNKLLSEGNVKLHDPFSEEIIGRSKDDYMNMLRVNGSDVMGVIEIPCIDVSIPIYHGTSAEVLENGVGHLEGTSLPVGGKGTHPVLTGHTGLSNAKLFTDLILMDEGDVFFLKVLGDKLAYKVNQIKVIEPQEVSDLTIDKNRDFCTLITCTPYGVNTHRLLVRGERIDYTEEVEKQVSHPKKKEGQWMAQYKKSMTISLGLIALVVVLTLVCKMRKKK